MSTVEELDELHTQQMKEAAARCDEKYQIRLRELQLAEKKQELEKKRHEGKVRKMEFEAQREKRRDERDQRQAEQFSQMMNMMFTRHASSQAPPPSMNFSQTLTHPGGSTFDNNWSAGMDGNFKDNDNNSGIFDDFQNFVP